MKFKRIIYYIIVISLVYFSYQYYQFNNKKTKLENIVNDYNRIYFDISWYLDSAFGISGEIPSKENLNEFLKSIDSTFFFKDSYKLEIDSLNHFIKLYSFFPSGKDNNLNDYIDVGLFDKITNNEIEKKFNFYNFIRGKKYNLRFFNDTLHYDCCSLYNFGYLFQENKFIINDGYGVPQKKINRILHTLSLEPGNYSLQNDSCSTVIFYYDQDTLRHCGKDKKIDNQLENRLHKMIRDSFPNYKRIKFSASIPRYIDTTKTIDNMYKSIFKKK